MMLVTLGSIYLAGASLTAGSPLAKGSPLEPRQLGLTSMLSSVSLLLPRQNGEITTRAPQLRADAKRSIIRYGPFTLPAYKKETPPKTEGEHAHTGKSGGSMDGKNMGGGGAAEQSSLTFTDMIGLLMGTKPMDPNGYGFIRRLSSGICKNCTVLAGRTSVNFENGTEAGVSDGVYIHHAFTMDVTKPAPTFITNCADVAGAISPFLGAGVDGFTQYYTTPDGKFPSGFYIKDDTFIMQAEIVNYKSIPQNIFIDMDIEYVPGKVGSDAAQAIISATECGNNLGFKPKQGTTGALQGQSFTVNEEGTIINSRGHMHDGGTAVQMLVNNKIVCSSNATYGGSGSTAVVDGKEWQTITKMSECFDPVPVKKGDIIKVSALYDTKAHPLRESKGAEQDNMGLITYVFVRKDKS